MICGEAEAVMLGAGANTDESSLLCLPLTSCYAAWFLTGHKPIPVLSPGVGDPYYKAKASSTDWDYSF